MLASDQETPLKKLHRLLEGHPVPDDLENSGEEQGDWCAVHADAIALPPHVSKLTTFIRWLTGDAGSTTVDQTMCPITQVLNFSSTSKKSWESQSSQMADGSQISDQSQRMAGILKSWKSTAKSP